MSKEQWAKMPINWQILPECHAKIRNADTGTAIAALKLYIVLCIKANFKANNHFEVSGCIQRSLVQLAVLAGISKPKVISGLKLLNRLKLIEIDEGRPMTYRISNYESAANWTKLPSAYLYGGTNGRTLLKLNRLSNRNSLTVSALQMYLYLASIRNRATFKAKVTYERLGDVLGISRQKISQTISALVAADLISVRVGDEDDYFEENRTSSNVYYLMGSITQEMRKENSIRRAKAMLADFE